jgi:DNA polymerase III epsilon subunit-like protein
VIVCIFDTETTGLIENHSKRLDRQPEVIEFASVWAHWEQLEEIVDRFEVLIKPTLGPISDDIFSKTHISNEMVAGCPTFKDVAHRIALLLSASEVVCGHNLSFDMEMLDLEHERLGRKVFWPSTRICTVEQSSHIAQKAQRKPSVHNRVSLADLHYYLTGAEHVGAHRAMADVLATHRCLCEMRRRDWL